MKSGEKLCPSIEKCVNCSCDIDQEASSINHIDPQKNPSITPENVIFNALFQQSEQIKLANLLSALIFIYIWNKFLNPFLEPIIA